MSETECLVDRESAVSVLIMVFDKACQQNTADYK